MSAHSKYTEFLAIARSLNSAFHCTPLLFGSLGLERRLLTDLAADDIDILLPREILQGHWTALVEQMRSLGFTLYDLHEHAFDRDGLSVAFAELEGLTDFAGIDIAAIPERTENGCRYRLLTLEDYRKVYAASAKDGYRRDKKMKNDRAKIDLIDAALETN